MKTLQNYKINYTEEPGSSLYPWAFQEIGKKGKQIGRDKIPFDYTVRFTAINLRYIASEDSESERPSLFSDEERKLASEFVSIESGGTIVADLRSGYFNGENYIDEGTSYSFLGCSRKVDKILLRIITAPEGKEYCVVDGYPSYKHDFGVEEDFVQITLGFTSERFAKLATSILSGNVHWLSLQMSSVDGLYTEWSHEVVADEIKLMPFACRGLNVKGADEERLQKLPGLRGVGEFHLYCGTVAELLSASVTEGTTEDEPNRLEELASSIIEETKRSADQAEKLGGLIAAQIWVIVAAAIILAVL